MKKPKSAIVALLGFFNKNSYSLYGFIYKLLSLLGTEVDPVGVSTTDSSYYLKKFVEVALPPGATKILDITSYVSTETHSSLVVGDNNRVYWSGSTQASSPAYISIGNYLSVSNSLGAGIAGSQDCTSTEKLLFLMAC